MKVVGNSVNLAPLLSCQSLKTVLTVKRRVPTIEHQRIKGTTFSLQTTTDWNTLSETCQTPVRCYVVLQHQKNKLCGFMFLSMVQSSYLFNETVMSRSNYHKLPEMDQASATPASAAASRINASCDIKSGFFCNAPWRWFDDVWCSQDAIIIKSSSPLSLSSSSLEDKSCNVAANLTCRHVKYYRN